MKERFFTLTLLSDIVLQSHSNTQGKNESRDFISGSVILGIVAEHYDEFSDPFAIFHSGAVRFGEAKPFINGKIGYKTPLCFFAPKDLAIDSKDIQQDAQQDSQKQIYNALFYDLTNAKEQLRQIRSGYINEDFKYAHLSYRYTQKVNLQGKSAQNQSLQNAQNKSTKDNEMFGYEAICKGAVFGFVVSFDENISNEDIEKITQILCQTHFIGKSKNAEYGEVLIESSTNFSPAKNANIINSSTQEITLYIASQLALFDNSMPTFTPNTQNLGLDSAKILWEKTHIKTKIHTPYNQKRKAKDSARLIIEQGSVITLTNLSQSDKEKLQHGKILCGGFLSEGYGEILINPSFLACGAKAHLAPSHIDSANLQNLQNTLDSKDSNLIAYIYDLYDLQRHEITSANAVDDFIATHKDRFSKVTNAQWGAIRAFAQMADDRALKDRILCYINEERLKEKWEEGKEILQDFIERNDRETIALLATRMPKVDLAQNLAQDFGKSESEGGK